MTTHLLSTADPYRPNGEVVALCGKKVRNPEIRHEFDDVPTGTRLDVSTLAVCKKCQEKEIPQKELGKLGGGVATMARILLLMITLLTVCSCAHRKPQLVTPSSVRVVAAGMPCDPHTDLDSPPFYCSTERVWELRERE